MRTEFPERLKKMKAMEGDLGMPGLGLSDDNKAILINDVSIIFNGAASLRLEAGLKDAIKHNTTGTKHVLDLAVEMKNLVVKKFCSLLFYYWAKLSPVGNWLVGTKIDIPFFFLLISSFWRK